MDLDANRNLIAAALARIPSGDRAALQTVYRLTSRSFSASALRILGERSEAEDVLQEVYVTVWRKAADFDANRASPMTWLIAIARNRAIDRLRATRHSRRMEPIEAGRRRRRRRGGRRPRAGERAGSRAACMAASTAWQRMSVAASARRLLRRQHLRRAGGAHERPARHHEKLDPAGDDQTEGLSRAMSDVIDHSGMPEDELLAAEYALGVLAGAERAAAERRIARERGFASHGRRLGTAAGALGRRDRRSIAAAAGLGRHRRRPARAAQRRTVAEPRVLARLSLWRARSPRRVLRCVIFLGAVGGSQPLVAAIDGGGKRTFVATVDAKRGTVAVVPAAFAADATRVPELWLIPADGKPRPLGLLQRRPRGDHYHPAAISPALTVSNAVLAVSLEPPGGSPTGLPTGPVIGTGKLTNL